MRFEDAKKKWRNDAPDNFPVRMVDCEIAFAAGWNAGLTEAEKVAKQHEPDERHPDVVYISDLISTLRTDGGK